MPKTFESWDEAAWRRVEDQLYGLTLDELKHLARLFRMAFADEDTLTKEDIVNVLDEVDPAKLKAEHDAVLRRQAA